MTDPLDNDPVTGDEEPSGIYVRIRSWHVIRTWTRVPNVALTLCGKRASGPSAATFGDDRSCVSPASASRRRVDVATPAVGIPTGMEWMDG